MLRQAQEVAQDAFSAVGECIRHLSFDKLRTWLRMLSQGRGQRPVGGADSMLSRAKPVSKHAFSAVAPHVGVPL
jgi:hypothetical protein